MAERSELHGSLLGAITRRMKEISDAQHELARQQRILSKAATQRSSSASFSAYDESRSDVGWVETQRS